SPKDLVIPLMRFFPVVFFIACMPVILSAQIPHPIYRSKADSTSYNQLQQRLTDMMSVPEKINPVIIDSLREKLFKLREVAIIGMTYRYQPDPNYTPLADIIDGSADPGQVKRLSISGWNGNALPKEIYQCTSLERLEIIEGSIKRIPRKLNRLRNLERLAIYSHKSE